MQFVGPTICWDRGPVFEYDIVEFVVLKACFR